MLMSASLGLLLGLGLGLLLGIGLLSMAAPLLWPVRRPRAEAARPDPLARLRDRLARAGLDRVPLPAFFAVSCTTAVAGFAVGSALSGVMAVAVAASLTGLAAPYLAAGWRARSARKAHRGAWPDVVDHLVSAVRSGSSLPDAVATLSRAGPPDLRSAFAAFEHDYGATGNFSVSVDALKERLADPTADRILEILRMSREVGGSELTAVLRNLSSYLRQEAAIRGEAEARQSWVVNAAKLAVAAPWLVLVLLSTRPEAAAAYNSAGGAVLIAGGVAVSVLAYRVMMRVARLPEERRWFR
jgi:tight adherence protein B